MGRLGQLTAQCDRPYEVLGGASLGAPPRMEMLRLLEDFEALEETEEEEEEEEELRRKLLIIAALGGGGRGRGVDRARFQWRQRVGELTAAQFRRTYRMSRESFEKLLQKIFPRLWKDER